MEFGDETYGTELGVKLNAATINYGTDYSTKGDPAIILNDLPFPFQFELESLPVFEQILEEVTYTYTGMLMRLKRKSLGQLLSGYYYPTATFAILSMVSFLINPDVVSLNSSCLKIKPKTKIRVKNILLNLNIFSKILGMSVSESYWEILNT